MTNPKLEPTIGEMDLFFRNRRALFDYKIIDDLEAGLVLTGPEIKAIRAKHVNLTGSYIKPFTGESGRAELWWVGSHFGVTSGDETRTKKLLLSRREIERLTGKLSSKGYTILPLELYVKRGRAKLKIGLGVSKKDHDKREELRERDLKREVEREFSDRQKRH
jgi:SsrA-binding protein